MDETPIYKRPWFYIFGWLVFLLIVYGWQIYRIGGIQASLFDILLDLIFFPIFLTMWMAFFAQFVLPVRTFEERQKIFDRLLSHLFGGHGPAMFIRDGRIIKGEGEEDKKGPGVVWLDSASAAVTRTAVKIKQRLGPGVHFLDRGETIAGTVDLHIQTDSLGPKENEKPFEPKSEAQTDAEYSSTQDRCKQVTALTRDGIEVVPTISVTFRVDTGFPKEGKPGSRFGFRIAYSKKDRPLEEKDKQAIYKAIMGESVKFNAPSDSIHRHRVAWNHLPALLAVDVWREYVGKFTLDELFKSEQLAPPLPYLPAEPPEEEFDPLTRPLYEGPHQESMESILAGMLRQINLMLARVLRWLEDKPAAKPTSPSPTPPATPSTPGMPQMKTALQVINDLATARLTLESVPELDNNGRRTSRTIDSPEFRLLQDRGLKVLSVRISNLRFHPKIESELIAHWESTWLKNTKIEKEQIERRRVILQTAGEEKAARTYATSLARGLMRDKPSDLKGTLKSLIMRSRLNIMKNEQLRRLMGTERQEIDEILQWMESDD